MWRHFRLNDARVALLGLLPFVYQAGVSPLYASDTSQQVAMTAVVRVVNRRIDEACLGSGTVVACQQGVGVVVSCAHLFTEGVGDVMIGSRSGQPQRALLVAVDEKNDLACLFLPMAEGATRALAAELPRSGALLTSCGFGEDGSFRVNSGALTGYATLRGGEDLGVLEITGEARHGDSGGPIFNARGELVAVIMGTDGRTVDGTHSRRIRSFLAQHPVTPLLRAKVADLSANSAEEFALTLDTSWEDSRETEANQRSVTD